MDSRGKRFELSHTRNCIKRAIDSNTPNIDNSKQVLNILQSKI